MIVYLYYSTFGEVSEWFKELVLKTSEAAMSPWVRIPPSPPSQFSIGRPTLPRQQGDPLGLTWTIQKSH